MTVHKIRFKLVPLLNKYQLSQRKLATSCRIRPATMNLYVTNTIKRVTVDDLARIYDFFYSLDDRITLNDIVEVVEAKKDSFEELGIKYQRFGYSEDED